jgi:hypothetical protein
LRIGRRKSGVRSQKSEAGSQKSGVGSQKPGVRSRESEVRNQESEVGSHSGFWFLSRSQYFDSVPLCGIASWSLPRKAGLLISCLLFLFSGFDFVELDASSAPRKCVASCALWNCVALLLGSFAPRLHGSSVRHFVPNLRSLLKISL